jgi:hypothetical protein
MATYGLLLATSFFSFLFFIAELRFVFFKEEEFHTACLLSEQTISGEARIVLISPGTHVFEREFTHVYLSSYRVLSIGLSYS